MRKKRQGNITMISERNMTPTPSEGESKVRTR